MTLAIRRHLQIIVIILMGIKEKNVAKVVCCSVIIKKNIIETKIKTTNKSTKQFDGKG
jgi:hypothetical protein